MEITSVGIQLGAFSIHFYGIILMTGAVAAAWLAGRQTVRQGWNQDVIWDVFPWALIGGILGARLWHIFTPSASLVASGITTQYYLKHPLAAIAIWNGGLGIPGAVIGGALAVWIYTRTKKLSFAVLADCVAPGLALGQAIGRWGNYVNQELYGAPSNLPWAIFIDPAYRLPGYADVSHYHPLFLYESLFSLVNVIFLLWISRRFASRLKAGDVFLTYLVTYPVARFLLEYLRLDPSPVGTINANQALMGVTALAAVTALILRHTLGKKKAGVEAEDHTEAEE